MPIDSVSEWWDRFGDQTKLDKINEIIAAINTNTSGIASNVSDILDRLNQDPDYDSGWFSIGLGATITKTHSLGTQHCLVYIEGRDTTTYYPHNRNIGSRHRQSSNSNEKGAMWQALTTTTVQCHRRSQDVVEAWDQMRIKLWKLV